MVIDDVFAVIADETRRDILVSLAAGDKAVGTLVEELHGSQPTVSKHLRVLREAGLVSMRAQGQKRFYSLTPQPLTEVAEWLEFFGAHGAAAAKAAQSTHDVELRGVEPHSGAGDVVDDETVQQQIGRTVGRAANRAADILANLPKFGRRRD